MYCHKSFWPRGYKLRQSFPVLVTGRRWARGVDPGVQAVSPRVTLSRPPGGGLPLGLLSARRAVASRI